MKINHGRSLFLAECIVSGEIIWTIRMKEHIIHENHGNESQLYFTHVKALLIAMLQNV